MGYVDNFPDKEEIRQECNYSPLKISPKKRDLMFSSYDRMAFSLPSSGFEKAFSFKGLSHKIDFTNFERNLQNQA
jgi:hypothetical protein